MRIFAKRVWGFEPLIWPAIAFGRPGDRDRLLKDALPSDCIVFVGTQGDETLPEDKGRLLGIAEIGRMAVATSQLLEHPEAIKRALDEKGDQRWPSAIPMVRAWNIPSKPLLLNVLKQQLPMNARNQGVLLDEEDQASVRHLDAIEVELPDISVLREQRSRLAALSGRSKGPVPSAWRGLVERKIEIPSVTYIMRFGSTDCWKIGHTNDNNRRLTEANKFIPHEVLGHDGWRFAYTHPWPTAIQAYEMEQLLLQEFEWHFKIYGERVTCSEKDLVEIWKATIGRLLSIA